MDDLLSYFKKSPREGQNLEFKSGEVDISKILKELCAFLNSEGGLLIVGAPRESNSGGEGPHNPVLSTIPSMSFLRDKIISGIMPSPSGIKLHRIQLEDGSVYLLDVLASSNPPHQLHGSGNYYIREGAVSRPALHREVEEMFFKKRKPHLQLQIEMERPGDAVLVRLIIENNTTAAAEDPGFQLEVFPVRNSENQQHNVQRILQNNYLAKSQRWVEETEVFTRNPRFFLFCRYYCKGVETKVKAAFAEIQKSKIALLEVFNSEAHDDFQFWYDQYRYLLEE